MEVLGSALKHGVAAVDIAHALTHHLYAADVDESDSGPQRVLYLGPDRAANLLEVVVVERDDGTELAIHAMKMRRGYEVLLSRRERRSDG
jgi:hypothetical protein